MDTLERAPAWLQRALPANATSDAKLNARIDRLADKLPGAIAELHAALEAVRSFSEYDEAANRASARVWQVLDSFYVHEEPSVRNALLSFATEHMVLEAQARVYRRLVKDAALRVRRRARRAVEAAALPEVALPLKPDGDWDTSGWCTGTLEEPLSRHATGRRVLAKFDLPPLPEVGKLRDLLGIRSPKQLGWFLLASDHEDGPYTRFTIPKRDGSAREICAPKPQLLWTQRQILDKVLARVPTHDAAHGFIRGRSTVTNAEPHQGAALILKFDLTDFFPTIHGQRHQLALAKSSASAAALALFSRSVANFSSVVRCSAVSGSAAGAVSPAPTTHASPTSSRYH